MKNYNINVSIVIGDNPDNIDKDLVNDWVKRLFNKFILNSNIVTNCTISSDVLSTTETDTITISGCVSSSEKDEEYVVRYLRKNIVSLTKDLCENYIESIVYKTSYLEVTY